MEGEDKGKKLTVAVTTPPEALNEVAMTVDVCCAPGSICVIHVGAGEVLLALVAERKNAEGVDHWASSFGHATCFHRSIRAVPRTIAVAV